MATESMRATAPPAEIDALTGLRFLAAAWVVVFHLRNSVVAIFPSFAVLDAVTGAGNLGVDLFFTLSGFILTYNYAATFRTLDRGAYLRFLGLRLARVYPLQLFTLFVISALVMGAAAVGIRPNHPDLYTPDGFIANVLLVQAWVWSYQPAWNIPSWSISAEWFAYLLFPLLAAAIARIRGRTAMLTLFAVAVVAEFAAVGVTALTVDQATRDSQRLFGAESPILRIAAEFVAGAALGYLFIGDRRGGRWSMWGAGSLPIMIVFVVALTPAGWPRVLVLPLFAVLLLTLARSSGRGVSRLLETRLLVFLGQASYALYMTHAIISLALDKGLPTARFASSSLAVRIGIILLYAVAIAAAALATYFWVERPARRGIRGLVLQGRAKRVGADRG